MQSKNQIIDSVNELSTNDKLLIVETILKSIREDIVKENQFGVKPKILELAGSITKDEANEWQFTLKTLTKIEAVLGAEIISIK